MDGNKDEALRCLELAEAALAAKNKEKALKFIRIAKRLDPSIQLDALLSACENLDSSKSQSQVNRVREVPTCSNASESSNGGRNYTEENVKLIREIKRSKDYYEILGVEKSCSGEEIRKAYRKLSLKVHPDKNKAPGADEAFKIVSKAFKCLSEDESRRQYDQMGFADDYEFEHHHTHARRRRRRATRNDFFEEEFDPDEIFRSFFYGTQDNVFRNQRVYRARGTAGQQREHNVQQVGVNWIVLLQILPIILFFVFASLPMSESHYSLQRTHTYQIPKVTEKHGVEYYVKQADFDEKFPQGSSARNKIENDVTRDYKSILGRYCHLEMQRRQWVRDYPTTHCDKLRKFAVS
ncbi:uncharacterized protein A4U43_C07F9630 [Asparagus officinalis]|uniref:J domain-containing protein n=1 Tax=Asparagus officinalis TaxID=4686 RepID=A0A5P1EAZ5_ASPOF|nr:chaperone protein dnaJ 49 [Asparagus officinalis]ONK62933.1 uncharacterized protein A4U43_C07F9630 [Asparagus officinalis]